MKRDPRFRMATITWGMRHFWMITLSNTWSSRDPSSSMVTVVYYAYKFKSPRCSKKSGERFESSQRLLSFGRFIPLTLDVTWHFCEQVFYEKC